MINRIENIHQAVSSFMQYLSDNGTKPRQVGEIKTPYGMVAGIVRAPYLKPSVFGVENETKMYFIAFQRDWFHTAVKVHGLPDRGEYTGIHKEIRDKAVAHLGYIVLVDRDEHYWIISAHNFMEFNCNYPQSVVPEKYRPNEGVPFYHYQKCLIPELMLERLQ